MSLNLKILIVDDNKNNLVSLRALIEDNCDLEVIEAQSPLTALDILMKDSVDMIITDLQMPDMDGFEFTELVRIRKKTSHIPIIMLTAAYQSEQFRKKGFELGVEDYITKPINDQTLIGRIKAYLRPIQKERAMAEELENQVKARTKELQDEIENRKLIEVQLNEAKESAENATKAKSDFLSMISHEIRTPMNAVIGLTNILLQDNPRPDQTDLLNTLKFSADNLLVIINDILDFSKIEAGKIEFEAIDFSLKQIFENIKISLMPQAKEKGIYFQISTDPKIPQMVIGDPVRISQIITNLVGNAIKFTSSGGVKVDYSVKEVYGDYYTILFSVTDTGIGLSAEQIPKLFQNFSQANLNTTRKFGGTGLGLSISKRLVELQHGTINVQSEIGKGSTFSFELKLKKSDKIEKTIPGVNTVSLKDLKGIRALIVEDNKINQMVAGKFLKRWNIVTEFADNGLIAIEKVKENSYDIILMDLQMPEMDGYESAKNIRQITDPVKANIPILALTASAMTEVEDGIFEAGMNDFLTKPFNEDDLYNKLLKYSHRIDQVIITE